MAANKNNIKISVKNLEKHFGSLEVLKVAVLYGADAVYIGGDMYGLRAKAKNFSIGQMKEGIEGDDNDSALAARIVGITTLFCLITMPLMLWLSQQII